jgi:hypothetical protein
MPAVRVWCRALYAEGVDDGNPRLLLSEAAVEELRMLLFLLEFADSAPFTDPRWEVEMYTDTA